jgi:hypothetical protein
MLFLVTKFLLSLGILLHIAQSFLQVIFGVTVVIRFGLRGSVFVVAIGLALLIGVNCWGVVNSLLHLSLDATRDTTWLYRINDVVWYLYAVGYTLFLTGFSRLLWMQSIWAEVYE